MRGGTAWELNPDNAGQGGEPEGGGVKTRVERSQMEVWGGGAKEECKSGRVAEARDARTGEGGQETGQIQWDARRSLTWMKGGRKTRDAFLGGKMDWVPLGRGRMGRGCLPLHTHSRRVAGAR